MEVIKNQFLDQNYKREYPFHRFALDFAWIDKKKCIQIDGDQHQKEQYRQRDERKDALLKQEGWEVLRIKWKDFCKETKYWIQKAKDFIEN